MAEKAVNKSFPCFLCGEWFISQPEQKAHGKSCKGKKAKPKAPAPKAEALKVKAGAEVPVVETKVETSEVEEIKDGAASTDASVEDEKFDRKDTITKLKDAGAITTKKSVEAKSDEELAKMLKEI